MHAEFVKMQRRTMEGGYSIARLPLNIWRLKYRLNMEVLLRSMPFLVRVRTVHRTTSISDAVITIREISLPSSWGIYQSQDWQQRTTKDRTPREPLPHLPECHASPFRIRRNPDPCFSNPLPRTMEMTTQFYLTTIGIWQIAGVGKDGHDGDQRSFTQRSRTHCWHPLDPYPHAYITTDSKRPGRNSSTNDKSPPSAKTHGSNVKSIPIVLEASEGFAMFCARLVVSFGFPPQTRLRAPTLPEFFASRPSVFFSLVLGSSIRPGYRTQKRVCVRAGTAFSMRRDIVPCILASFFGISYTSSENSPDPLISVICLLWMRIT